MTRHNTGSAVKLKVLVRLFIMSPLIHIQQHFDADTNRDDDNHGSDDFLAASVRLSHPDVRQGLPGKHHQPQRPDHFTAENEEQNRGNVRRQVNKIRVICALSILYPHSRI
jgi:hypothetical protein